MLMFFSGVAAPRSFAEGGCVTDDNHATILTAASSPTGVAPNAVATTPRPVLIQVMRLRQAKPDLCGAEGKWMDDGLYVESDAPESLR
jgi:hypothetical protein